MVSKQKLTVGFIIFASTLFTYLYWSQKSFEDIIFVRTTFDNNPLSLDSNKTSPGEEDVINPHPYGYFLNAIDLCRTNNKGPLKLIVLVCSAAGDFKEREMIRNTWGKVKNTSEPFRVGFLLARTQNTSVMNLVKVEFSNFSDLIVGDFLDTYKNLTLKSMMLLKWVTEFCSNVQFVLKTDDDMYINIPNLLQKVDRLQQKNNIIFGFLFRGTKPDRNPSAKWYVPKEQFGQKTFPDYLSGTGYMMSIDSVPKLYWASLRSPFVFNEDVFITGVSAEKVGVQRKHESGFDYSKRKISGCAFKDAISGHHVSVNDMQTIYNELQKTNLTCKDKPK